jgi:hypothetical protein
MRPVARVAMVAAAGLIAVGAVSLSFYMPRPMMATLSTSSDSSTSSAFQPPAGPPIGYQDSSGKPQGAWSNYLGSSRRDTSSRLIASIVRSTHAHQEWVLANASNSRLRAGTASATPTNLAPHARSTAESPDRSPATHTPGGLDIPSASARWPPRSAVQVSDWRSGGSEFQRA